MANISSNSITHFTGNRDGTETIKELKGILHKGFYPRYSLEKFKLDRKSYKLAFPLVCFCNIPFFQIKDYHLDIYGSYGIGLSEEWGRKNGINPVIYTQEGSNLTKSIENIALIFGGDEFKKNKRIRETKKRYVDVLRYIKPYRGDFVRYSIKIEDYKFYDEKELRYAPACGKGNELNVLLEKDYEKQKNEKNKKMEENVLTFKAGDVEYIIVKYREEKTEIIKHLKEIVGYDDGMINEITFITAHQIRYDF